MEHIVEIYDLSPKLRSLLNTLFRFMEGRVSFFFSFQPVTFIFFRSVAVAILYEK
jgi:hypothetical protein